MAEADPAYQLSDPTLKKLSQRNGIINRMQKDELKAKLEELELDSKGVKEVLKKRLKNYFKKRMLAKANVVSTSRPPDHDYLVVIDFEATCEKQNPTGFLHEIIEFPAVLIEASTKTVVDEFQSYVRPEIYPQLSTFCTELTGIEQHQVDRSPMFPEVLGNMEAWMVDKHRLGEEGRSYAVLTDGPWDMSRFMANQCHVSSLPMPTWSAHWVNVRKTYANFYSCQKQKLTQMMDSLGLPFRGQLHSGIDDARNIAQIALRLLHDGARLRVNERLVRLPDEDGAPCYQVQNITADQAKRCIPRRKVKVLADMHRAAGNGGGSGGSDEGNGGSDGEKRGREEDENGAVCSNVESKNVGGDENTDEKVGAKGNVKDEGEEDGHRKMCEKEGDNKRGETDGISNVGEKEGDQIQNKNGGDTDQGVSAGDGNGRGKGDYSKRVEKGGKIDGAEKGGKIDGSEKGRNIDVLDKGDKVNMDKKEAHNNSEKDTHGNENNNNRTESENEAKQEALKEVRTKPQTTGNIVEKNALQNDMKELKITEKDAVSSNASGNKQKSEMDALKDISDEEEEDGWEVVLNKKEKKKLNDSLTEDGVIVKGAVKVQLQKANGS